MGSSTDPRRRSFFRSIVADARREWQARTIATSPPASDAVDAEPSAFETPRPMSALAPANEMKRLPADAPAPSPTGAERGFNEGNVSAREHPPAPGVAAHATTPVFRWAAATSNAMAPPRAPSAAAPLARADARAPSFSNSVELPSVSRERAADAVELPAPTTSPEQVSRGALTSPATVTPPVAAPGEKVERISPSSFEATAPHAPELAIEPSSSAPPDEHSASRAQPYGTQMAPARAAVSSFSSAVPETPVPRSVHTVADASPSRQPIPRATSPEAKAPRVVEAVPSGLALELPRGFVPVPTPNAASARHEPARRVATPEQRAPSPSSPGETHSPRRQATPTPPLVRIEHIDIVVEAPVVKEQPPARDDGGSRLPRLYVRGV